MTDDSCSHFIGQLKERRPEIADFLMRCENNHLEPEDLRAMRNCVRRLLELTENRQSLQLHKLARTMSEAVDARTPAARIDLISLSRALLAACHEMLLLRPNAKLPSPAPAHAAGNGPARKPVVLTVDDDRVIRGMIEAMFGHHASVLMAENGKQGLQMIRDHRPDAVLLDDTMPEMTGMTLIEHMRDDPALSRVAVIMLTSSDRPQDVERAMAAGARDYVIKPFDPAILTEKLFRVLEQQAASRSGPS